MRGIGNSICSLRSVVAEKVFCVKPHEKYVGTLYYVSVKQFLVFIGKAGVLHYCMVFLRLSSRNFCEVAQ